MFAGVHDLVPRRLERGDENGSNLPRDAEERDLHGGSCRFRQERRVDELDCAPEPVFVGADARSREPPGVEELAASALTLIRR